MSKKVIVWSAGVVSVLLVGVIVAVSILVATINRQADEQAYSECVDRVSGSLPHPTREDQLDGYFRELADAADFCSR